MIKKWTFSPSVGNFALILLGTAINLFGRWLAEMLFLPIWLDSVGTFISAVLLGPIAGALSGGLMNVIVNLFVPGQIWFSIVSIGGGVAVGLFFPRGKKIEPFSVIATALFAGLVMTVLSLPLNLLFNGGYTGHPWGDALVDMLAPYLNLRATRCLLGGLLVNMPDKALSILIAMCILFFARKRRDARAAKRAAKALSLVLAAATVCAALSLPAMAADFDAEYASVVYGREDGLAAIEINAIAQTADGYIWAGAYSGLYRYNGSRFERMELDERISSVMCMYEDGAGALWIGTNDSGLACWHISEQRADFYTVGDGLPSDSVRAVCGDGEGGVVVGTAAELCRIDAQGQLHVLSDYPQLSAVRSLSTLWSGLVSGVTEGGELFILRGGELVSALVSDEPDAAYTAVAYDGAGHILVGTSGNELLHFRVTGAGRLELLSTLTVEGLSDVNRIRYVRSEGGYFVAASAGIFFLDRDMNVSSLSRSDFSIAVSDMIVDYQNNIWFSSSKQGIMKLSPIPFADILCKAGVEPTAVNALLSNGGDLYVGTDQGLAVLNTETCELRASPAADLLTGERVRHLMRDSRGNVWVCTYGQYGLACISPGGEVRTFNDDDALLGSRFRFATELSDGTILASSTKGLNFLRGGRVVGTVSEENGLTLPKILSAVECPDGTILAGSDGDGVYRIRNGTVVGHIGSDEGLLSPVVLRIVPCLDGYLYVTSNGIYFHEQEASSALRRLKSFPYSNNYDVYLAPDGNAWVSSSAGLYVVNAEALVGDGDYNYVLLDYRRGFDTTLTANAWNAADGTELYLCCSDGVKRINTETFNNWNSNYRIEMSSLCVEGEPVEYRDGAYQLPSGQGRVQLWPAVLNYAPSDPLVSIRMEGADDPGVLVHQSEMNSEYYMALTYGDYRIRIQVLDELSGAVRKEESFRLHKEAELYERTYYKIYLALVATMLVAFLAWMIAKMSNMAIINRQYDQIKEAKEEAEYANQAKSRFLANMSHEIRTPINAVLGMDEMILRESGEPEIRGYAADIFTAGNTLLSLINDILDSSKIESGKMEIVPVEYELTTLIRDLYNMISQRARAKDLDLQLEVDEALPRSLFGDDVRVRQVVTNILTNAVKYTPSGTVWFRVSGTRDGADELLRVEVEDTGIGIKEEDLPKLFEAFQRIEEGRNRNIEGTGLGMNITLQLLAMMGSKLEVESVYGKGSKFFFTLRQKIVDETPIGAFSVHERESDANYRYEGAFIAPDARVLVVDDNAMNLKVFRSLLKPTQIRVTEADSGKAALALAESERFDMVFMDHMMPDMDGVETMHRMREIGAYGETPIYVLTANAVSGAREQYLADGFDGFVSKPIVSDKLEAALREALPQELLKPYEEKAGEKPAAPASAPPEELPTVDGLDWTYAWLHLPERELLESTVREFGAVLFAQADKLERMWTDIREKPGDADALAAYRIQVHGMKSAAATIGIVPLAGMAKMLEFAARDGDEATMERLHGVFLAEWRSYRDKLDAAFPAQEEDGAGKEAADADMLRALLGMLKSALEDLDVDAADEAVGKLKSYRCAPEVEALFPALAAAVADLDEEEAGHIMEQIEGLL